MTLLRAESLGIGFGGVRALDDVSFTVDSGIVFSIIGPNGAGKTTLFNVLTGLYRAQAGRILLDGGDITRASVQQRAAAGMQRTFQNLQMFGGMTAAENVMVGAHHRLRTGFTAALLGLPSVRREDRQARETALRCLGLVGLDRSADELVGELPYGALKRLEIARALAARPRLLLLDEPAAGLSARERKSIGPLVRSLVSEGITVLLVEHDMGLVMDISDRILVLDFGRVLAAGAPAAVRSDPAVVRAYLGRPAPAEQGGA